jgi:hypothetical protein
VRELSNRPRELHVSVRHCARIMACEPEVDAVPDIGELGVMIDFLGMKRDPRQKGKGFAEITELEGANESLAAILE